MAEKSPAQERIWTMLFMFLVTLVSMAPVSGLQVVTKQRVEENQKLFVRRAVMEAAGLTVPKEKAEVMRWFERCVQTVGASNAPPAYRITDPQTGAVTGYVFVGEGPGLWGRIRAAAGLDGALQQFVGVTFLEQVETPGLGARIEEPWYKAQFKGKHGTLRLVPEKTRSQKPDEIDAITGATITSVAVRDILNGIQARAADMAKSEAPH
jgi:Na+-transporting NADH:ubiquinone oxidoreductase subunit C